MGGDSEEVAGGARATPVHDPLRRRQQQQQKGKKKKLHRYTTRRLTSERTA